MTAVAPDAVTRFRTAFLARDLDAMTALLAPDCDLYPATGDKPYRGHAAGRAIFRALMDVFEDARYLGELAGAVWDAGPADARVLLFRGRVDNVSAQSIALFQVDDSDRIAVVTSMVRPMSALTVFSERMRASLAAEIVS
ncbi:nuclear transport factor 2 family protein [Nocardia sp. NPDC051570]|uniref:nuclear transport factor 2 family protein n=1 Tax=Nocardia sp. NPDC051570 TaxID=3364324 RepID=UPI0037B34DDF